MTEQPAPASETAEVFYAEATQALGRQETNLDELRNRTSHLLAIGGLVGAFFASQMGSASNAWAVWAALASFLAMTVCVLFILWPTSGWVFRLAVDKVVDLADRKKSSELDLKRTLALAKWKHFFQNEKQFKALYRYFRFACVLLVLEICFWFAAFGGGIDQ